MRSNLYKSVTTNPHSLVTCRSIGTAEDVDHAKSIKLLDAILVLVLRKIKDPNDVAEIFSRSDLRF